MAHGSLVNDVYMQYLDPTHRYVYVSVQYVVDFAFRWAMSKDHNVLVPQAICVVVGRLHTVLQCSVSNYSKSSQGKSVGPVEKM